MQSSCQKTNFSLLLKYQIHHLLSSFTIPFWATSGNSLISGPEHNSAKSFLGRVLELDHKPKALWSPYCSQILAHPTDPAAWAGLRELPSSILLPVKCEQPQQWGGSCCWYRRGMSNCLGSGGAFSTHQRHLHTRWNPTRSEEVISFLAKYPAPAAAGQRGWWEVVTSGICASLVWLTKAPYNLQREYFPPVFLLCCTLDGKNFTARTLFQAPTAGKCFSDAKIDGCKKNYFRSLKIPYIRGGHGFEANFPEEKWLVQKSWKTT